MTTYLHRMKCIACNVEYIVCSMFEDWSTGIANNRGGPFCPECGSVAVAGIGTVGTTELEPAALRLGVVLDDPCQHRVSPHVVMSEVEITPEGMRDCTAMTVGEMITALDNYCRTGDVKGLDSVPYWVEAQWHIHNDQHGYRIYVGADEYARPVHRGDTLEEALRAFMGHEGNPRSLNT